MTAPDLTELEWTALLVVALEGYDSPFLKCTQAISDAAGSAIAKMQAARINRPLPEAA